MIARVSLEIALRKEFDYSIPAELAGQIDVGSRVQVPFGPRKILGVVTAIAEESGHANLKPILKVIGAQTLGDAKSFEARAVDRRILLLRAGNRVEIRFARSRAQGRRRLARKIICPRAAGERRISEVAEAAAGSLEPHRGAAGNFAGGTG